MAETNFVLDTENRYRIDYDPQIVKTIHSAAAQGTPRLWDSFGTLAHIPTLCIRGALSDVLRGRDVRGDGEIQTRSSARRSAESGSYAGVE